MSNRGFSNQQIVTIVVAICLAIVLAPVGVYAASIQKVRLVDKNNAARAAKVAPDGRVLAQVRGNVSVRGYVNAANVAPSRSFSVAVGSGERTLRQAIPSFTRGRLMITSLTFANNNSSSASYAWIYKYGTSTCGSIIGYHTYLAAPPDSTAHASFPTPLIIGQRCALVHVGAGMMTITGYRVP